MSILVRRGTREYGQRWLCVPTIHDPRDVQGFSNFMFEFYSGMVRCCSQV